MRQFASERARGWGGDVSLIWLAAVELGALIMLFGIVLAAPARADGIGPFDELRHAGAEPLTDSDLSRVRARGVIPERHGASAETNVILWDEAGRGRGHTAATYAQSTGNANAQGNSIRTQAR